MPAVAPIHLVERLKVLEAHVRHLAGERRLEADFQAELAGMGREVASALASRDRQAVEAAIERVRSSARRMAAATVDDARLGDARGVSSKERAASLSEAKRESDGGDQP